LPLRNLYVQTESAASHEGAQESPPPPILQNMMQT
jgi:hypothetical protein